MVIRLPYIFLSFIVCTAYVFSQDSIILLGKQTPQIIIQDIKDSSTHKLSEYTGSVLFLNIWSRGCLPCIKGMPDISQLQEDYEGASLKVVFLGPDIDTQNRFFKIYKTSGIKARIVNEWNNIDTLYRCGTPTSILIDRDSILKDVWFGAIGYDAMEA
jgi:thiol-disulfide isomerase/thioredoxin